MGLAQFAADPTQMNLKDAHMGMGGVSSPTDTHPARKEEAE